MSSIIKVFDLCRIRASSSSIMNPAETSIATRPTSKRNHVCRYREAIALTHQFMSGMKTGRSYQNFEQGSERAV